MKAKYQEILMRGGAIPPDNDNLDLQLHRIVCTFHCQKASPILKQLQ